MGYLDIILCIPLLWGLYKGYTKGLIIQLASLVALIFGVYGSIMFSNLTQDILTSNFQIDNKYIPMIAFAVTFLVIIIAVHVMGKILEKMVNMIALGLFNKLLGAGFGLLKAALILSALIFVFEVIDKKFSLLPSGEKAKSFLYTPMSELIPTIAPAAQRIIEGERVGDQDTIAATPGSVFPSIYSSNAPPPVDT
jgi:membrane protein required for colicin V production